MIIILLDVHKEETGIKGSHILVGINRLKCKGKTKIKDTCMTIINMYNMTI